MPCRNNEQVRDVTNNKGRNVFHVKYIVNGANVIVYCNDDYP